MIKKFAIALHNYLIHNRDFGSKYDYYPESFTYGDWRQKNVKTGGLQPLSGVGFHNYSGDDREYEANFVVIFRELDLFLRKDQEY